MSGMDGFSLASRFLAGLGGTSGREACETSASWGEDETFGGPLKAEMRRRSVSAS